jgi:hypothetical protein
LEDVVREMPSITGHPVVDTNFEAVGTVTDVIFDDRNMEPRWAVVKIPGLFGGEHFMPVDNSYVDEDGNLIVPWNKDIVKKAPKPHGDHIMTPEVATELSDYYGAAA